MHCRRWLLSLICLGMLVFPAFAAADTHEELVARYIELSGLGEMLASVPGYFDALASQKSLTSKNSEDEQKVYRMLEESFDVRQAEKDLSAFLLASTDEPYLRDMLRWLESPLARKITREETNASGAESRAEMLRYLADLQDNPPSQQRIELIQGVEQATHMAELTADILIEVMMGMLEATNAALPADRQGVPEEAYREIDGLRTTIESGLREQMVLESYYTYRNITDAELAAYIGFYETDLGQTEIEKTGEALTYTLKNWFDTFVERVIARAQAEAQKRKAQQMML